MKKNQVLHILDKVGESPDVITLLDDIRYIVISKTGNIIKPDITNIRFEFKSEDELMNIIYVRKFSDNPLIIPNHSHYDIIDGVVYEYLTEDGNLIFDSYLFDSIDLVCYKSGIQPGTYLKDFDGTYISEFLEDMNIAYTGLYTVGDWLEFYEIGQVAMAPDQSLYVDSRKYRYLYDSENNLFKVASGDFENNPIPKELVYDINGDVIIGFVLREGGDVV